MVSVTAQGESGVLSRRSTPLPAWALISGRSPAAIGTGAAVAVAVILIGAVVYGATVPGGTIPLTIAIGALRLDVDGEHLPAAAGL